MVGRNRETKEPNRLYNSGRAELVAVYGQGYVRDHALAVYASGMRGVLPEPQRQAFEVRHRPELYGVRRHTLLHGLRRARDEPCARHGQRLFGRNAVFLLELARAHLDARSAERPRWGYSRHAIDLMLQETRRGPNHVNDSMRAELSNRRPREKKGRQTSNSCRRCQKQAARHALPVGGRKPRVVVGCPCWRG